MLLLDTHALFWLMNGDPQLGRNARHDIENALQKSELAVSSWVFWEMALLQVKKRLPLGARLEAWRQGVLDFGVLELPVTGFINITSWRLENFHHDPSDRIMVSSALHYGAALVTADAEILRWKGGLTCINARK